MCTYVWHMYVCHRHEIQARKEMKRFRAFVVFLVMARMLASVQMNAGCSGVHVQWFSHWKIEADDCDIIS